MEHFTIQWVTPWSPSSSIKNHLDTVPFRMGLQADTFNNSNALSLNKPSDFHVELWTNLYHKTYNEGKWHRVSMKFLEAQQHEDKGGAIYLYGVDLMLTCLGTYSFTFRARHKYANAYIWSEKFEIDGHITILQPVKDYTTWVQEPEIAQVTHNVYLGNHNAALKAPELGFDCMLNMADDADVFAQQFIEPIIFKKLPVPAGANNVISDAIIDHAVKWLRAMSDRCRKVLVCSRSGHGRAGSILLAFIYSQNPNLDFHEAFKFVDSRFFIYNHRGLKKAVARLYRGDIGAPLHPSSSEEDLTIIKERNARDTMGLELTPDVSADYPRSQTSEQGSSLPTVE